MESTDRNPRRRWGLAVLGLLLVVFGAFCLNYTRKSSWEHHVEWAAEKGLPGPSNAIRLAGYAALVLGVGVVVVPIFRREST